MNELLKKWQKRLNDYMDNKSNMITAMSKMDLIIEFIKDLKKEIKKGGIL